MATESFFGPLQLHLVRQHGIEMELAFLGIQDKSMLPLALRNADLMRAENEEKRKTRKVLTSGASSKRRRLLTNPLLNVDTSLGDEHRTHRPPLCCPFCCCCRIRSCRCFCRITCALCQNHYFVALFRDATDPRFWMRFAGFKMIGLAFSVVNIARNFVAKDYGLDVALILLIFSAFLSVVSLFIMRNLLKEAVRTEHGSNAVAPLRQLLSCCGFCIPSRLCCCCCCCCCKSHVEDDDDSRTYHCLDDGDDDDGVEIRQEDHHRHISKRTDAKEDCQKQQQLDDDVLLESDDTPRRAIGRRRRYGLKMEHPLTRPTVDEARERLTSWTRRKMHDFDTIETFRAHVLRVFYKRARYETWLSARVDQWLLEHSAEFDVEFDATHSSISSNGSIVEKSKTQIIDETSRALAIARMRWKLRKLNFGLLQQRVAGRTLWVMLLDFIGGFTTNAGAVLILLHQCDCSCESFQWTVVFQMYWGLLSVSLDLGSCFDRAIEYVSNRYALVVVNKTMQVIVCVVFSILQFVYLTMTVIVIRDDRSFDDESACHPRHLVKLYFAIQIVVALASSCVVALVVTEKFAMRTLCPRSPTHIWSLIAPTSPIRQGGEAGEVSYRDVLENVDRGDCWSTPF